MFFFFKQTTCDFIACVQTQSDPDFAAGSKKKGGGVHVLSSPPCYGRKTKATNWTLSDLLIHSMGNLTI